MVAHLPILEVGKGWKGEIFILNRRISSFTFVFMWIFIYFISLQAEAATTAVSGITLNPTTLTLNAGDTHQLTATIVPSDASNQLIRWSSSDTNVAIVDSSGGVTAKSVNTVKEATIIATTVDGGKVAYCTVTVQPTPKPATAISLSSNQPFYAGGASVPIEVAFTPIDATNRQLTWVSTNRSVAEVDGNGMVTPKTVGETTIIATTDTGMTATATISVVEGAVRSFKLNVNRLTLPQNDTFRLTPTITPSTANTTITYESSQPSVATVDANGEVRGLAEGTAVIKATSSNGNLQEICQVTIVPSIVPRSFQIKRKTSTTVDLTWSANGKVYLELLAGSDIVKSFWNDTGKATLDGLDRTKEYKVYLNGRLMTTFKVIDLPGTNTVKEFKVQFSNARGVDITWAGSTGEVYVELKNSNGQVMDTLKTSNKTATFTDLEVDSNYTVYIDGLLAGSFKTKKIVQDFVAKATATSVEITWTGTYGRVDVDLERAGTTRHIDHERTDERKVRFTDLDPDTNYKVYIEDEYAGGFKTSPAQNVKDFRIVSQTSTTVELRWTGTKGTVEVELRRGSRLISHELVTGGTVKFTDLDPGEEYKIYIDGELIRTFETDGEKKGNLGSSGITLIFRDVSSAWNWAHEPILGLYQKGIVNGYEDGNFRPANKVNREEFVTLIVRAKGYSLSAGNTPFRDVPPGYWAAPYVATAIKNGVIIPGEYRSDFHPLQPITREEMAIMIARALDLRPESSGMNFKDDSAIVNKPIVHAVAKKEIIEGYPDGSFLPKGTLNRAEAAKVIYKMLEK